MIACPVCHEHTKDGLVCWTCTRRTIRQLNELPWLYAETRRTALGLVRLSTRQSGHTTRSNTPPLNLHASRLADEVSSGLATWARIAIERGAPTPPANQINQLASTIARHLNDLRHHEAAHELITNVSTWTSRMLNTINLPPVRKIEVGPCPLDTTIDGTTSRCQGTVWAVFPRDQDGPPVHAACSWCCDPDAQPMIGLWATAEWRTLGRLIDRRKQQDTAARRLAAAILGQPA